MPFSKKVIEELAMGMIYSGKGWRRNEELTYPPEKYAHLCEESLGWKNLAIDFNGARSPWDDLGPIDYCGIDLDTVLSVKEFFIKLYVLRPFTSKQLTVSRHIESSYHLKHVMESIRRIAGDGMEHRDGYVSNGEFIVGYILFLTSFLMLDRTKVRKIFTRSEAAPNLYCRLPSTFSALERYLHDRRAI